MTTKEDVVKSKVLTLLARQRCRVEAYIIDIKKNREECNSSRFSKTIIMLCCEERLSMINMVIKRIDSAEPALVVDTLNKIIEKFNKQIRLLSQTAISNGQSVNLEIQAIAETLDILESITGAVE